MVSIMQIVFEQASINGVYKQQLQTDILLDYGWSFRWIAMKSLTDIDASKRINHDNFGNPLTCTMTLSFVVLREMSQPLMELS